MGSLNPVVWPVDAQGDMRAHRSTSRWRLGLVGRFAVASLVAFVAIGAAISILTNRQVTRTQELDAQFHAEFVAESLLAHRLKGHDLSAPFKGREYRTLDRYVRTRILDQPVKRVKLWRLDGTVLYSDEGELVGSRFPGEPDKEVREGEVLSEVSDLSDPENRFEKDIAPKLFATYVPLYRGTRHTGRPDAVVELYQDYASIETRARSLLRDRVITLGLGLVLLYVLLLPIVLGASRRLRRQNDQLEEQARRLSVLLAGEQKTVAELRTLNQMKSDFAAVASHEMRTPLTAILGYVKTLRQPEFENDPRARSEFMAAIDRQAERLFRLVTNLLTAAQVEKHEAQLQVTTFDLGALAEEVAEGFHEGGSRIRLAVPGDLPHLVTDRVRVGEILTNLIDNALKYSPDEAPVDIGATVRDDRVVFWVQDCGVGIETQDLARIFERFYQTDQSSTRRFGGVGLGLHLVAELVNTLGGRVEVESAPGVGSTFTVTLPMWLPIKAPRRPDVPGDEQPKGRRRVFRRRRLHRPDGSDSSNGQVPAVTSTAGSSTWAG
jgi:signal transduction histidine kinase